MRCVKFIAQPLLEAIANPEAGEVGIVFIETGRLLQHSAGGD
jgi:hypothetical protein